MRFASFVYDQILKSYKNQNRDQNYIRDMWNYVRIWLIKLGNPECKVKVRSKFLYMPISHQLPIHVTVYPFYDELLTRVSDYIRREYGYLNCIDVGANIGSSIMACLRRPDDRFLAIEANPHFIKYIKKNCQEIQNFKLLELYCSSSEKTAKYDIKENQGTATIKETNQGHPIVTKSLDAIIDEYYKYREFNFLKIDTDGHDFEVIKGAKKYISRNLPAILFECDVFDNEYYVERFLTVIHLFIQAGYTKAIVYDNFGYLFGVIELDKIEQFKYALIYQLISDEFYYFDILLMKNKDIDAFLRLEMSYFIDKIPNELLQRAAKVAAAL